MIATIIIITSVIFGLFYLFVPEKKEPESMNANSDNNVLVYKENDKIQLKCKHETIYYDGIIECLPNVDDDSLFRQIFCPDCKRELTYMDNRETIKCPNHSILEKC